MPNFTVDQVREIMDDVSRIRNMSVIAHVDHGKTTLTDSLIAKAGIITGDKAGTACKMDSVRKDQAERGITIKSTGVSLYFESNVADGENEQPYLINLIDSPGHLDFSSEVTAALRVTDGALVVVDYVEGVCVQTETVLRQALGEKIKPVMMINKIDRGILELKADAEQMYQQFQRVIEDANVVISTYECDDMPESQQVDPTLGTVAFGSGYYGWAFTLTKFADLYAKKFKVNRDALRRKLWGDNFFDPAKKGWSTTGYTEDGKKLDRSFVQYILKPIIRLSNNIVDGNLEPVWAMVEKAGLKLKAEEKELRGKDLFRAVFKKWINAAEALLEMIIMKLPSPKQAQAYRAAQLYEGPIEDACGQAIKACDKDGPLMVFISKMVPTNDTGRFYAFGRVFSGTVATGQKVRIMGPNYRPGGKEDLHIKNIQKTVVMMAGKAEAVGDVPCGNTVGLVGIDKYLTKQGTLSDHDEAHCIKAMKYSVSPVVRVAVQAKNAAELPKLIDGLNKLAKSDPLVQCYTEESGEHIIAGCGELHVEICLKDLEDFSKIAITKGEPVVAYKETVTAESSQVCRSKSKNNLNRLYATAQPLGAELTQAIEDEKVSATMDPKVRNQKLVEEFEWDAAEAKKIWSFGPDASGPNMLVDVTKQA